MPTYAAGLHPALATVAAIALALAVFGIAVAYRAASELSRLKVLALTIVSVFVAPTLAALSMFPMIFGTFNLGYQEYLSPEFWRSEFANGVFAVRVSSYVLTFHFFVALTRYLKRKQVLNDIRGARGLNRDQVATFSMDRRPNESALWRHGDLAFAAAFQFIFYLAVLAALWLCAIEGSHSLVISVASWCLFFIADDWVIISDYTDHFNASAIPKHTYRVLAFDFALLGLVSFALIAHIHIPLRALLVGILIFALIGICMFTWRANHADPKNA